MKLKARIQAIYLAPSAGVRMEFVSKVSVNAGLGIEGDRYALGKGAYSAVQPIKLRHVSFIALAGIETANDWLQAGDEPTFDGAETRRNIVINGMTAAELNNLVGRRFQLGNIELLGTELCTPCERPAQLLKRPSFMEAFEGRGGIRAEVLNSGVLTVGDELIPKNEK